MQKTLLCDKCRTVFYVTPDEIKARRKGDLEVMYYVCPNCHAHFLASVTNAEMRNLIQRRMAAQIKVRLAVRNRFRKATQRKWELEVERTEAEQKLLLPDLIKLGDALLAGISEHEVNEDGQG